jgi:hypothetical protein
MRNPNLWTSEGTIHGRGKGYEDSVASQHTDADRVLNASISLALDKLVEQGEFYPFGVALTREGQIAVLTTQETPSRPTSDAFLSALQGALLDGARSGSFKATAIVADFSFEKPRQNGEHDAIRVSVESAAGEAITCFLPYVLVTPGGTRDVRPGQPFAQSGERSIFT